MVIALVWFGLVISVYLSSLPVAHLSDAQRRRLVVTGDSAKIQDETTVSSAWFFNPLPDDKILDRSNLKQSADDNFKFDENSRKFSKQVDNTVGKREIARYE